MLRFQSRGKALRSGLLLSLLIALSALSAHGAVAQEVSSNEAADDPQEIVAEAALAAALTEAEETDRLVFLHTGADW